jgi:hypothetical protein
MSIDSVPVTHKASDQVGSRGLLGGSTTDPGEHRFLLDALLAALSVSTPAIDGPDRIFMLHYMPRADPLFSRSAASPKPRPPSCRHTTTRAGSSADRSPHDLHAGARVSSAARLQNPRLCSARNRRHQRPRLFITARKMVLGPRGDSA